VFIVDYLARPVGPVHADRQIDFPFVLRRQAPDQRLVAFLHRALLELAVEVAMRIRGAREDHDARGVEVEAMHDAQFAELFEQARRYAVSVRGIAARYRQQAMRFVDYQQVVVDEQHRYWPVAKRDDKRRGGHRDAAEARRRGRL
jgi:hypothetical protein